VLILILLLPFFVYGQGKIDSDDILKGHAYYVNVNVFENKAVFGNQERVKYLGKNSDFIFFLSENNNKVYILKFSDNFILELIKE
jgi:hypothetical protein